MNQTHNFNVRSPHTKREHSASVDEATDRVAANETKRQFNPAVRPPTVIAVCNQKGGVAKTTTALSLGACLAEQGQASDPSAGPQTGGSAANHRRGAAGQRLAG